MNNDFVLYRTTNKRLLNIVDYFFYLDIPTELTLITPEDIIPYPRVTFGYFFNHPFSVSHNKETISVDMIFSRLTTKKVTVQPQSNKIKIIGVHLKPYALAYFTTKSMEEMPLVIEIQNLFKNKVDIFKQKINQTDDLKQKFSFLESLIIGNLMEKDLSLISKAVEEIESFNGIIKVAEIAKKLKVSERTLQNHFKRYIGCSTKEYIQLVKLKKSIIDLKLSKYNLTAISYDNDYFDQSHFIKTIKTITGKSPKNLQKEMPNFRFLQF